MSKLRSIVFHDNRESPDMVKRLLEFQFSDDRLYVSISWQAGKGGMRAESFALNAEEARRVARDILERMPDPGILEDNLAAIQG